MKTGDQVIFDALAARGKTLVALAWAYGIGYENDSYADGRREAFVWKQGADHRHMMGLAFAAEYLVALRTNREWLNASHGPGPDHGDVDGVAVRWTEHDGGGLAIRPGERRNHALPHALVTGGTLAGLRVRGWLYMHDVKRPEWYRSDWLYPAWCAPQESLRSIVELVRWVR